MRDFTLEKFETVDKYSKLLNHYMDKLFCLDLSSMPLDSMKEVVSDSKYKNFYSEALYELHGLNNCLHSLHSCITGVIKKIDEYEEEFEFDFKHYATVNRVRCIEKYGSDDPTDWNDDDDAIAFKEDDESLKYYTLNYDIQQFFDHPDNCRGEQIGSSNATDYQRYSTIVRQSTDLSAFKALQHITGKELEFSKVDDKGNMVKMSTADKIEDEINEDIANGKIADLFEIVLDHLGFCLELFNTIDPMQDEAEKYRELRVNLTKVLNVDYSIYFLE